MLVSALFLRFRCSISNGKKRARAPTRLLLYFFVRPRICPLSNTFPLVDLVTEWDVRVEELVKLEIGKTYPTFHL
jgi:hypothetical protein